MTIVDLAASEQPSGGGSAHLTTVPYDATKDRETARRNLAYWLLAILTLVIIGLAIAAFIRPTEIEQLVAVFLTPIVGLVGTVLGFYFGGEKR